MKQIEKLEHTNESSPSRGINPETFFQSLKQLGETLGYDNQKFMQMKVDSNLKTITTR